MKKTALIILLTAAVTAIFVVALLFFLMPTLGPRFMHSRMAENMPAGMPAHGMNSTTPAELDTDTNRLADNGLFRVAFVSDLEPIAINQMHSWTLHVTTPEGEPVENAVIIVGGGMPDHGHGLPTNPQVTEYLGDGRYRVEGLRFQMGGWWEVAFDITADGQNDTITFNFLLEG
jgi:hypothetical protein